MKKLLIGLTVLLLTACPSPADVASHNVSAAADAFEVQRRIVFFNGITDTYLLSIEGRCSLGNFDSATGASATSSSSKSWSPAEDPDASGFVVLGLRP